MRMILTAALAVVAAGHPHGVPLQAQTRIPDSVQIVVRNRVDSGRTVGMVVGVVDAAGVRYFSYGNTAMQGGQPVNEHTVFEIGSVTKVFTALVLADMVRRGEVGLDDPVSRFVGGTLPSRNGREITLRLLSAQRSGLPRMPANFRPSNMANPYEDYGPDRMLDFIRGYTLPRDPGEQYEYSNLGVGLLGFALSSRLRTSYEQMVADRILTPLGMRETMITLTQDARAQLAMGHSEGRQVSNWDIGGLAGAGALRSTAADMLSFLSAAVGLRHSALDPAFAMTFEVQGDAGRTTMDVGLGWHILKRPTGMRIVWHNGGTGGYRSWAGFDPARRIGVVVLSNSSLGVDAIGMHVLDETVPIGR